MGNIENGTAATERAGAPSEERDALPDVLTLTERFEFLDDLRDAGITNMFGAAPYLVEEFEIPIKEARETLRLWMRSFDSNIPAEERANDVVEGLVT